MNKFLLFIAIFMFCVSGLFAQDKPKVKTNSNEDMIITLEMIAASEEYAKKDREMMANFDSYASLSIKAELNGVLQKGETVKVKKQDLDKLKFIISIKNKSPEEFEIVFNDGSRNFRPQLFSNDRKVDYSDKMKTLLRSSDNKAAAYRVEKLIFQPGSKKPISDFAGIGNIQNWYDNLPPGFYKLVIDYDSNYVDEINSHEKISTNPIFLEIEP